MTGGLGQLVDHFQQQGLTSTQAREQAEQALLQRFGLQSDQSSPGPRATRAGFTGGATGPFVSPSPSPEGQMWAQVDSAHVPDSYMHHAYQFVKSHSSGLRQNVEDFWNMIGKPQKSTLITRTASSRA